MQYVRSAAFFGNALKGNTGFSTDDFQYARSAKTAVATPHTGTAPAVYRIKADVLNAEREATPYRIPYFPLGNLFTPTDNGAVARILFDEPIPLSIRHRRGFAGGSAARYKVRFFLGDGRKALKRQRCNIFRNRRRRCKPR